MESGVKLTEPPETDLDYYARPENYTGSNLSTLTRFLVAKDKEEGKVKKLSKKKQKNINEERQLYRRYRHILPVDLYDASSSSPSASSSSEDEKEKDLGDTDEQTLSKTQESERNEKEKIDDTKKSDVTESSGNGGIEESRLPTIRSSESEESESETESGYGSRLRSQEEQFRDTSHLINAVTGGMISEAWAADDSIQDPTLRRDSQSPHEWRSPSEYRGRASLVSLTGSVSTKPRDSSVGLGSVSKLRGKLIALSNESRRRRHVSTLVKKHGIFIH
ncbi:hypothetical protein RRG08_028763 [Elysia crispata]|uniref:Uncharacterized protein n=1 Tax=Elysia crispata TaxID=231223 RepID=A0AAE1DJ97_9GAST|nr:hypothetical protein RRG08_028763 [Elysia crispata]